MFSSVLSILMIQRIGTHSASGFYSRFGARSLHPICTPFLIRFCCHQPVLYGSGGGRGDFPKQPFDGNMGSFRSEGRGVGVSFKRGSQGNGEFVSKGFSKVGQLYLDGKTGIRPLPVPVPSSQAPALYLPGEKELVNQEKMTTRRSAH